MVNGQCLTTMVTTSWRSSGPPSTPFNPTHVGYCGLVPERLLKADNTEECRQPCQPDLRPPEKDAAWCRCFPVRTISSLHSTQWHRPVPRLECRVVFLQQDSPLPQDEVFLWRPLHLPWRYGCQVHQPNQNTTTSPTMSTGMEYIYTKQVGSKVMVEDIFTYERFPTRE